MTENAPTTQATQRETRVGLDELRALLSRSDFWRPDVTPSLVTFVDDALTSGSNKWGRVQVYARVQVELPGGGVRLAKLAMSKRNAGSLLVELDAHHMGLEDLPGTSFQVVRRGRGLDTAYDWTLAENPTSKAANGAGQGRQGGEGPQKATATIG
jgi:hypothetical protein